MKALELGSGRLFSRIEVLDRVGSTNDYLKELATGGRARAVMAREQTEGRGRYGRRWSSVGGEGLCVSYLFYPGWSAAETEFLNIIPSLAVLSTLRELGRGRDFYLKRPNDVLAGGRKICGILAELATTGHRIDWAIIGIGLNVYQREFPDDLPQATSLLLEGIEVENLEGLCRQLTVALESGLDRVSKGRWTGLQEEYEREVR